MTAFGLNAVLDRPEFSDDKNDRSSSSGIVAVVSLRLALTRLAGDLRGADTLFPVRANSLAIISPGQSALASSAVILALQRSKVRSSAFSDALGNCRIDVNYTNVKLPAAVKSPRANPREGLMERFELSRKTARIALVVSLPHPSVTAR